MIKGVNIFRVGRGNNGNSNELKMIRLPRTKYCALIFCGYMDLVLLSCSESLSLYISSYSGCEVEGFLIYLCHNIKLNTYVPIYNRLPF